MSVVNTNLRDFYVSFYDVKQVTKFTSGVILKL